jgi:hypothetical protein
MRGDPAGSGEPRPGNRFVTFTRLRAPGAITDIIIAGSRIAARPSQLAVFLEGLAKDNHSHFLAFSDPNLLPKSTPRQVT